MRRLFHDGDVVALGYTLPDEPRPTGLARLVVDPMWPLFGFILGGPILAWPWFVLNAWAWRSPTRGRETALAVAGPFLLIAALIGILALQEGLALPDRAFAYLLIVVHTLKVAVSCVIYRYQVNGFAVYTAYGGPVRQGMPAMLAGSIVVAYLVRPVMPDVLRLVLG